MHQKKIIFLSFIRPLDCDTFGIHNPIGLQLLTRLLMALSHLNEHKFEHNFSDFLNNLCACNMEPETTSCYLEAKLFASHQSLVTSHQSLVTIHQLLVTSHQLLVTSYQSLVTSYQSLVTSHQLLVTNHYSLVSCYSRVPS